MSFSRSLTQQKGINWEPKSSLASQSHLESAFLTIGNDLSRSDNKKSINSSASTCLLLLAAMTSHFLLHPASLPCLLERYIIGFGKGLLLKIELIAVLLCASFGGEEKCETFESTISNKILERFVEYFSKIFIFSFSIIP